MEPTTKVRVDLGLRLAKPKASGRLEPASSMRSGQITARIPLRSADEVDDEVVSWIRRAYAEND